MWRYSTKEPGFVELKNSSTGQVIWINKYESFWKACSFIEEENKESNDVNFTSREFKFQELKTKINNCETLAEFILSNPEE